VKCEEPIAGGALGTVRVVAGMWSSDQDPMPSDSGDDGPADQARLNNPTSVAVGACNRPIISLTRATTAFASSNGDGVIRAYAGEAGGGCGFEGDDGPALNAKLCAPTAVRYDRINQIVFADTGNDRVRRISTSRGRSVRSREQAKPLQRATAAPPRAQASTSPRASRSMGQETFS
jgi:hypothetical protein